MIEAGKVLQNRYRVEKQIGQGGMGAVYVATDERFGSTVAIKETLFMDEKFRKAFEREARLLNSLRHPALPRVSDHFIEGNGQFLVMEFIEGEDLAEQLEHEGEVFSLKDVLNWADQLLDALEYLHAQEMPVIHRDIKPQNLKLTSRGQIILLDFGLAKGNTTAAESATAAKSVFGYSRNYASLEQIQGTGTDPRSDLYALAATLYHLLTGVPPADALTRAMVVLSDKDDPLIEADQIRREIPAGVARVLHQAMALNASQRPTSAQEMRAMLAAVKDEKPSENVGSVAGKRAEPDFFTQKTQLQPGSANLSNLKESEMQTAVLPVGQTQKTNLNTGDFADEETKVRSLAAVSGGKHKRRGVLIGAVAACLLLVVGAASAIYVYQPQFFGNRENLVNPEAEKVNTTEEQKSEQAVQAPAENATVPDANASASNPNANPASGAKENAAKTETKQIPNKTETAKTESKAPKTELVIVSPDEKDETAEIEEEPEDEEALTPPKNPKTGKSIPPYVWRGMTIQQRRQLKQALRIQQQQMEQKRREQERRRRQNPPPVPPPYWKPPQN